MLTGNKRPGPQGKAEEEHSWDWEQQKPKRVCACFPLNNGTVKEVLKHVRYKKKALIQDVNNTKCHIGETPGLANKCRTNLWTPSFSRHAVRGHRTNSCVYDEQQSGATNHRHRRSNGACLVTKGEKPLYFLKLAFNYRPFGLQPWWSTSVSFSPDRATEARSELTVRRATAIWCQSEFSNLTRLIWDD